MTTKTEKMDINEGHGENYRLLWDQLLDQREREDERRSMRDAVAGRLSESGAIGFPALSVRLGSGKSRELSPHEVAINQWRAGGDMVGRLILETAQRAAARTRQALIWRGCKGAGVAAGAESAGSDSAPIKYIDHADESEFCSVFVARLWRFRRVWSTVERLRSYFGRVYYVPTRRELAICEGFRRALRLAGNECRNWICSRGGVRGAVNNPVSTVSIDDPTWIASDRLYITGEAVLMRAMSSGGKSGLVMVDRDAWAGNADPLLGWSRYARASSWQFEIGNLELRVASLVASARPQDRARVAAQSGELVNECKAVFLGEGQPLLSLAIGDDGENGSFARDALRKRCVRLRDSLAKVETPALVGCALPPVAEFGHGVIKSRAWGYLGDVCELLRANESRARASILRASADSLASRARAAASARAAAEVERERESEALAQAPSVHLSAALRASGTARNPAEWAAAVDRWEVVADDARSFLSVPASLAGPALLLLVVSCSCAARAAHRGIVAECGELRRLVATMRNGKRSSRQSAKRALVASLRSVRASLSLLSSSPVLYRAIGEPVRRLVARAVRGWQALSARIPLDHEPLECDETEAEAITGTTKAVLADIHAAAVVKLRRRRIELLMSDDEKQVLRDNAAQRAAAARAARAARAGGLLRVRAERRRLSQVRAWGCPVVARALSVFSADVPARVQKPLAIGEGGAKVISAAPVA